MDIDALILAGRVVAIESEIREMWPALEKPKKSKKSMPTLASQYRERRGVVRRCVGRN